MFQIFQHTRFDMSQRIPLASRSKRHLDSRKPAYSTSIKWRRTQKLTKGTELKKSLITLFLLTLSLSAAATEQTTCSSSGGTWITGYVTSSPTFASSKTTLQGVKLTHTHFNVRSDQDGKTYDVAVDNIFAVDYVLNATTIPRSLAAIRINDYVGTCGATFTSPTAGTHFVHTNCGATPTASKPNGWLKTVTSTGYWSTNVERSQTYCYLFN